MRGRAGRGGALRENGRVRIEYPADLPVSDARDEIMAAIRDHQVVIVAGATGSGKTTQLPKMCLELGRTRIGHTQPRRLAARTIAERIAEELGTELGQEVGYKVRFTDQVSADTRIKVMTDGILLAEMHRDKDLRAYDTIIIDEAHERSLTIDFLIGYLQRLLPRRPDLKVIVTSATIDPESFSRHFGGAPIIEVSGRTFPVDIRYRPLVAEAQRVGEQDADDDGEPDEPAVDLDPIDGIEAALKEIAHDDAGDVLVFLPSEADIRDAQDQLQGKLGQATEILPLYGRLSAADQHRVFERSTRPGTRRRVVLATNVAETSLTVPGIRHVIDTGTARISRYSARSKVQRLPIEAISQASANQRSGRAGRVAPGIAIRLYSEEDFERRPEFTDPEILRTNLAAVILQAASLGLGPLEEFPFLQPPDPRGIKDGHDLLRELGAIDAQGRITRIGRELARLPVDPRFGRMAVAGRDADVAHEVIAIVAGLTIQDPRERPLERREEADRMHARFVDPKSDFITLLALWRYLQEQQATLSGNQFRKLCKAEHLSFLRVREWQDVVRQLTRSLGLKPDPSARRAGAQRRIETRNGGGLDAATASPARPTGGGEPAAPPTEGRAPVAVDADAVHKALLSGLLGRIGRLDETQKAQQPRPGEPGGKRRMRPRPEYIGARGARFHIFPGSGLAKSPPRAVMAAELVETSRLFARTVASVDLAWAEPLAGDLAKRQVSEPHWERKQGAVVAYEKVTLFGVTIVERRRVQYARIDPEHARELFIRHALVEGEWDSPQEFDRRNRELRREIERLEERQRRRDLLVGDEAVFDFFDARIPADVASTRSFEGWWRRAREETPELLTMTRRDLTGEEPEVDSRAFPTKWHQGEQRLRLSYRFEPGAADDGLTVHVPLAVLPRLGEQGFDWLVPGMREELLTAMIKSLPKHVRKHVVPAGDWARGMLAELPDVPPGSAPGGDPGAARSLAEVLAARISRTAYVQATATDVDWGRIPDHLKPTFAVEDARGRRLGQGKDLEALKRRFAGQARTQVAKAAVKVTSDLERDEVAGFDTDLPEHIDVREGGNTVRAYPGYAITGRGGADAGASTSGTAAGTAGTGKGTGTGTGAGKGAAGRATVGIRLAATREAQQRDQRAAVRQLLLRQVPSPAPYVQANLTSAEKLALGASPYASTDRLFDDLMLAIIDAELGATPPATVAEFEALRSRVADGLVDRMFALASQVARILTSARLADRAIRDGASLAHMAALADARANLDQLVFDGFVSRTGLDRLPRLEVYVRAIEHRVKRLPETANRDRAWMTEVEQATALYAGAGGTLPLPASVTDAVPGSAESARAERLVAARWLLEELRVSLFAQQLGTAGPVSLQRIRKALAS
ncbi:ATP-dependent RNA helicase HrpA [Agrococcus sp. HG114]|uniref:ATP-dependent RNA helicase HrpA n=1 Tax=Agrococcus sp. HG114 TaxID=2969757 RepID=UPI00215B5A49|nr:ATP-dependent RNA helicase HrpA [Agrococcus sp. HG114]MCR8669867.1 ATP-dependent RNA helicase HrpA [Agrococcus sp. HG114]